jgi:hypothetical protein
VKIEDGGELSDSLRQAHSSVSSDAFSMRDLQFGREEAPAQTFT